MGVNERSRLELHEAAKRNLGARAAVTLMEMLPPAGWGDVATKQDLALVTAELHADLAEMRADLAEMRAETRADLAGMRADLADTRADLARSVANLQRWTVTIAVALAGIIIAVSRLS